MPTTPASQFALATDPQFKTRVHSVLITQALAVMAESPGTDARRALALNILKSAGPSTQIMNTLVSSTNLVAGTTSYDFAKGAVITDTSDAALLSQIAALWNTFVLIS